MTDPISGSSPEDPRAVYKQDFAKSVDLFQKSLDGYQSSQIPKQKEMYKDVMDRTLQIMNETAKLCLSKNAQVQEKTLANDYQDFLSNDTPAAVQKLNSDIDELKGKL